MLAGYACLLLCAYYDNIRGPLLPKVADELGLSFSQTGWFMATGYAAATFTSYGLIGTLNAWSERRVILAVSAMAIACGILAPFVTGFPTLLGLGALVGGTITVFGTMSNVFVIEGAPPKIQGKLLSGLHAMFGFGSMGASSAAGFAFKHQWHWSLLFAGAIPLYLTFAIVAGTRIPERPKGRERTRQTGELTGLQKLCVGLFAIYVAGEVTTAIWLPTYLVEACGVAVENAPAYLTGYFLALTAARLLCFAFITPRSEKIVLVLSLAVPLAAHALGRAGMLWAFALMGLYGPFFPVLLARISRTFPDKWRAVTIWSIVAMNVLIGIGNVGLGSLADWLGISGAFYLPPACIAIGLALLVYYFHAESTKSLHISLKNIE